MDQQSRVPKAHGQQSAKDLGTAWSLTFNKKPTRPAAAPEPLFYHTNQYFRYASDGHKASQHLKMSQ